MSYERQNATKRSASMQVALDRRAARMLRAREARLEGKMDDATKQDVDASLATLKEMRKLSVIEPATAKLFGDLKFLNAHAAAKYTVIKSGGIKYNAESDMKVVLVNLERGLEKPFDPKELKVVTPYISNPWHAYEKKVK
ncbi:TPA: hypothetical protein ACT195_002044 [Raoultella planticola]|jgi:hypothetical protein|uniref:hypothetical protein n=1 Tax=Raoultella TaxID=160674 RepID=UPI0005373650|nr:hypothetical protein [Raoultella planticola]MDU3156778.1 hypothetical protein [Hafnia alvei]AUU05698.1 hypothetical protein MC50_018540 [Raoultella planticola]MBZ7832812.1 hypothetical protein [Raoultella planticola]MDV1187263.1 hypothetical protein [Raoultella planticola]PNK81458.1 hypothetical protein CEP62_026940 [Raoultella planticola]